jgi:hypothetical protein
MKRGVEGLGVSGRVDLPAEMATFICKRLKWGLERHWSEVTVDMSIEEAASVICGAIITGRSGKMGPGAVVGQGTPLETSLRKRVHADCDLAARAFRSGSESMSPSIIDHVLAAEQSDEARLEHIDAVLEAFRTQTSTNLAVFEAIKFHHTAVHDDYMGGTSSSARLEAYAEAAVEMGSKAWVKSGMTWMEGQVTDYFVKGGAKRHHIKAIKRARGPGYCQSIQGTGDEFNVMQDCVVSANVPVRLLDIGSCYNPFRTCPSASLMDVTAVDLYPAQPWDMGNVYACDFLDLEVGRHGAAPVFDDDDGVRRLRQLPGETFDVATISLVLSYLPTPEQRVAMLRKARDLLNRKSDPENGKYPGVLLLMEKASMIGINQRCSPYLRHWKDVISACGFQPITYQLLGEGRSKFHCFAYRASELAPDDLPILALKTKTEIEREGGGTRGGHGKGKGSGKSKGEDSTGETAEGEQKETPKPLLRL